MLCLWEVAKRPLIEEEEVSEELVGVVDHWYGHLGVAGVRVTAGGMSIGDKIRITGHTTDLTTTIDSMQIEHDVVSNAGVNDQVGIKVPDRVRVGDEVYLLTDG
jgi:translation elongation factor EF-1alpha